MLGRPRLRTPYGLSLSPRSREQISARCYHLLSIPSALLICTLQMAATAAEQISNAPKSPLHHAGDKVSPRAPDKPSTPFKPPDTLPIEIPIPEIRSAFQSAVTGDLESDLKNNASLQAEDITNLARQTYKNPTTKQTSFVLRSSFFSVEYELMDEHNLEDRVFVNITNCEDAFTAQKMMADYLGMFQADVSMVTKRSEKELGQVALQTEKGVFWVRDAMWIQLWEEKARRGLHRIQPKKSPLLTLCLDQNVSRRSKMHYPDASATEPQCI